MVLWEIFTNLISRENNGAKSPELSHLLIFSNMLICVSNFVLNLMCLQAFSSVDYEALTNPREYLFTRKLENMKILPDQCAYMYLYLYLVYVSAIYHVHLKKI